jgi:hypothetical protein
MDTTSSKQNQRQRNLIILLTLALIGTWMYILIDKNTQEEVKREKDNIIAEGMLKKDQLQKELEDASQRFEAMKTSGARKDSAIMMRDKEIIVKQERIQALLSKVDAGKDALLEARKLIGELNVQIDEFKLQMEKLQQENIRISNERDEASRQRDEYSRNFDSARQVISEKENSIDIGTTLSATDFRVTAINEKRNGKEVKISKMKHEKINKLRLEFNLEQNRLAPSGVKDLFVIVTGPDGKIIRDPSGSQGFFISREGEQKDYSMLLKVNYVQNQRQLVNFDWRQSSPYQKGKYKMEVYQNGFNIGGGICELK